MNRKQMLAVSGAAAVGAVLPAKAAKALAPSDQGVLGSWFATVTATNPPLGSFNSLMSFHDGGVFTESRRYYVPATPLGDLLETTGHGAWNRTGNRSYEVFFRFLLQHAPPSDGAPVGTDNIRLQLSLDTQNDTLSGTFESNIKDNAGNVIFTVQGTISAERIQV